MAILYSTDNCYNVSLAYGTKRPSHLTQEPCKPLSIVAKSYLTSPDFPKKLPPLKKLAPPVTKRLQSLCLVIACYKDLFIKACYKGMCTCEKSSLALCPLLLLLKSLFSFSHLTHKSVILSEH